MYLYSIPFYYGIFYYIICLIEKQRNKNVAQHKKKEQPPPWRNNSTLFLYWELSFSILVRFLILVRQFSGLQIHIQIYPDTEQLFRQTLWVAPPE